MALFQWLKNMNQQPMVHIPEETHATLVRRRFRFSGLVQGVGFAMRHRGSHLNWIW